MSRYNVLQRVMSNAGLIQRYSPNQFSAIAEIRLIAAIESADRTVSRVRENNERSGGARAGARDRERERSVFLGGRRKQRAAVTRRRINNR